MARRKRKLEEIEALDRSGMTKPQALPPEAIEDVKRTINDACKKSQADPTGRTDAEGLQILRGLIDEETNPDKKEFHERIFGIARRMHHRKKAILISDEPSQLEQASDSEVLPLSERLKYLNGCTK